MEEKRCHVPRYVCACGLGDWHLRIWDKARPLESERRIAYSCRSWRHEGDCRLWKGAQDFVRVREAMRLYPPWVYVVLTFAQRDWPDKWKQYRAGVTMWSKLRKRLVREYGPIRYVQTWERHKRGGAHVNVAISNEVLYEKTCRDFRAVRSGWLEPSAVACGFGMRTWIEPLKGVAELAGYLTKLSRELTGAGAKSQIPEDAPPHFRRIRASAKTLPPVIKSDLTGQLVLAPLERFLHGRARGPGVPADGSGGNEESLLTAREFP